jgi:glycosyltransferase involved in cell wall biosynthesis
MAGLISIITAVYQPVAEYVTAAYESIVSQQLPEGWSWQWVIQEDGATGNLKHLLPQDARISAGSGRRGGACVTRTMSLSRAAGDLIKVLDADDMLTPGALAREIDVLSQNPDINWTTARVLDLLPDGSTVGFELDPPGGRLQRGSVLAHWRAHHYRAQVHPATLCIRRDLVMALGGWMALPASSDTGLLMAADAVSDGYFIEETGLLYRKWPGQVTSQSAHTDSVEWPARMKVIETRAKALASLWNVKNRDVPSALQPDSGRHGNFCLVYDNLSICNGRRNQRGPRTCDSREPLLW